jgi:hypothetical protein
MEKWSTAALMALLAAGAFIAGYHCPATIGKWLIYGLATAFAIGALWWPWAAKGFFAEVKDRELVLSQGGKRQVISYAEVASITEIPDAFSIRLKNGKEVMAPHYLFDSSGMESMHQLSAKVRDR